MAFEADTTQDILKKCFNTSLSTLQVTLKGGGSISLGAVRLVGTASALIQGTTTYGLEADVQRLPNNVSPNISSIQNNISAIQDNISAIQPDVSLARAYASITQNDISSIQDNISSVQDLLSVVRVDTSQIQVAISNIEPNISTMQEDMSVIQNDISTMQDDVSLARAYLSTMQPDISIIQVDASQIQQDLSTAQQDISSIQDDISVIQNHISSIADWEAAQSTVVVSIGLHPLLEAVDVDGAVIPNPVAEGQGARAKGTLWGVQLVMPVSEDGSQSYPSRDRLSSVEIQSATTITAAETVIGSEIDISQFNTMTIFIDYTIGDETSYDIIPKVLRVTSGDEHAYGTWSSGATKSFTAEKFRFTASGKHYITLDITGLDIIKIYGDATGGTPTGTSQLGYLLSNN